MVQIIEADRPLQRFGEGFGQVTDALGQYLNRKKEDKALKEKGFDIEGVRDPRTRQMLLESQMKKAQTSEDFEADEQNYNTIRDAFGDKFANVWKASPTGARTELLRNAVEANLRGYDLKKLFGEEIPEQAQQPRQQVQEFPAYKLNVEGMTPKETIGYQKELRGYNDPEFKKAEEGFRSSKKALDTYKELQELSPKIPQGLNRFFYDREGNIRPLAQTLKFVPPEAEKYVKIINDFTTQAKDSFGARVTNFDLATFMKRLPTLANSEEGRKLIIDRMKLVSEADMITNQALKEVYRHYGLGKITPEDATEIAEQRAEEKLRALRERSEQLDEQENALSPIEAKTGATTNQKKSLEEIFG